LIKDTLKVLLGTAVANLFTVIRTFMIVRQLNPETYGVWNLFTVLLSYSIWCELGVLSGMDKMVPIFRGQSRDDDAEDTRNVAFTSMIIIYSLLTVVILLVAFIPAYPFSPEILTGLKLLAVVAFLAAMQNFYLTVARAEKKFGIIGIANGLFAIMVVAGLFIYYKTVGNKLHATLLSFILAYSTSLFICIAFSGLTFRFRMSLSRLKTIIPTGFPLILIGIGYFLFTSVDRWIIAKYMTKWELGQYAFSYTCGILLFSLGAVVAYVLYPRMLEKFGEGCDDAHFRAPVYMAVRIMSYVIAFSTCVLLILLPVLGPAYFPSYVPALPMTAIMVIGFFFISVATIAGNFLVAANRERRILLLQIIGIVAACITDYAVIKATGDVRWVVRATACCFSLYGVLIIYSSFRQMRCNTLEAINVVMNLAVPLLAAGGLAVAVNAVNEVFSPHHRQMVIIPETAILATIYAGLFLLQNRDDDIRNWIRNLPMIKAVFSKP